MTKYLCALLIVIGADAFASEPNLKRGKYLVTVAGCNDCHTSGFAQSEGKIPESEWLKGDSIGWKGPWGTTYPINLRKFFAHITKEQWLSVARNSKARPPMPSYVFKIMTEEDLTDIYGFIHSLGDAGEAMPAGLPPGVEPKGGYFNFFPVGAEKK